MTQEMSDTDSIIETEDYDLYFAVEQLTKRIENLEQTIKDLQIKLAHQKSISNNQIPEQNPQISIQPSNPESSSTSISRSHLDLFCTPMMTLTPEVSVAQIAKITLDLEPLYTNMGSKNIASQVRKWFRKRREEMGIRIITSFRNRFETVLCDENAVKNLRRRLDINLGQEDYLSIKDILEESDLEIRNLEAADSFARSKLRAFLDRIIVV